jgi:membrane fusion protein, heavy metal efflux system
MMNANQESEQSHNHQGTSHPVASPSPSAPSSVSVPPRQKLGFVQRFGILAMLIVLTVPPAAGFYSYFSGIPLHLLASTKDKEEKELEEETAGSESVSLVPGQAHTIQVPDEVATRLGIRKGQQDLVAVAQAPTMMRPIVLPGSTALDPARLDRIRARFAPARVVEIAKVWDQSPKTGQSEQRELRSGDRVSKGDVLGVFYSVDVGSKKNDLLDALVQLELDQKILEEAEKHAEAIPKVFLISYDRAVQGDRNAINRALNNLKAWDIPQEEIDALHAEAKKISADKDSWAKTPEGRWVKGEKQATGSKFDPTKQAEDPWGRVTLRADFDGVIVERNVHVGEMVVDNTVNLFQIADVDRLLVITSCPEDALPTLESLHGGERRWTVRTVGTSSAKGLRGTIDEIGFIIDPNQHTAVIKGYVENPGNHIRAGQYVTSTVNIPAPSDVVEIPSDALVDDGLQSVVFVQADPALQQFTMRRVQVTHRFEGSVFVKTTALPKEEQLTEQEAEEGLLPKEPLRPGERVLLAGSVELKAAMMELESRTLAKKPTSPVAKAKIRSALDIESGQAKHSKTSKS